MADSLQAQILDYIVRREYVSYAELSQIDGFRGGDRAIFHKNYPNLICWIGLTEEAANAVLHLLNSRRLHHKPTSIIVYLCDGALLNLPLVKSASAAKKYKNPHWFPVTLNSGPGPEVA